MLDLTLNSDTPVKLKFFDDVPNSCEKLIYAIEQIGISVDMDSSPSQFAGTLNELSEANNDSGSGTNFGSDDTYDVAVCGYAVDNHIRDMDSLEEFDEPEEYTNNGNDAGWTLITKVLIPKISSGVLPYAPIVMVSGQPLDAAEGEYSAIYRSEFPDLFFVRKQEFDTDAESVKNALEAIKYRKQSIIKSKLTEDDHFNGVKSLVDAFAATFELPDSDLKKIFRQKTSLEEQDLIDTLRTSSTTDWEFKLRLLVRLASGVDSIYRAPRLQQGELQRLCADHLRDPKWGYAGKSLYEFILSGSEADIHDALSLVLSPVDYR